MISADRGIRSLKICPTIATAVDHVEMRLIWRKYFQAYFLSFPDIAVYYTVSWRHSYLQQEYKWIWHKMLTNKIYAVFKILNDWTTAAFTNILVFNNNSLILSSNLLWLMLCGLYSLALRSWFLHVEQFGRPSSVQCLGCNFPALRKTNFLSV